MASPLSRRPAEPTQPQAPADATEAKKKRKWAPKVRTGCRTCRIRKVKCDEAEPACMRCTSTGRTCDGYLLPRVSPKPSGVALNRLSPQSVHSTDSQTTVALTPPQEQRPVIAAEILPGGWHYLESIEFFNKVVRPHCIASQIIPTAFNDPRSSEEQMASTFVSYALAVRIFNAPVDSSEATRLRTQLYQRVKGLLLDVNQDIVQLPKGRTALDIVLRKINGLKGVELLLQSPGIRTHMEGFLNMLSYSMHSANMTFQECRAKLAIHDMLCESIMSDTVSPPNMQLVGLSLFTEQEILYLYSRGSHPSLPCPTKLLAEILAVTRLRVQAYKDDGESDELYAQATALCERILAFKPKEWVESYTLPDVPEVALLADVFKTAVALYALLSLSGPNLPLPQNRNAIVSGRSQLVKQITNLWKSPNCRSGLNWPLAVLGCALADGSSAERALVSQYLAFIATDPTTTQPLNILRLLKQFWETGKTEWDVCWQEPFVVIG